MGLESSHGPHAKTAIFSIYYLNTIVIAVAFTTFLELREGTIATLL